jgi:ribosomal protein S18 acetylase RimI-like enzyme
MSLLIRQATAQDLPQILQLYAQPSMDNGKVMALAAAKQQFAHFSQYPSYRLFVACQADADADAQEQVLGTYALLVMHNLAHQGTPSAIVEDVVVSEAHRSQGVGRAMMAHAMDLARQAGCYKLVLSSNQKRERAHAFYESLGFQRHGFSFQIEM